MNARPALGRRALFAIFTLSGFSGLIYESIWSHYLKLFLGHAAYAQTLVLTVFMGGMALGAWLTGRFTPRLRSLLGWYALVEIVTGAIALVFHPLYVGTIGFTFDHIVPALDDPLAINGVKWLIAALLILPQSILLGATFPLISGGVVRRFPERPGATLAMLYFTNSLGAALGVLASGFFLIGRVGLPGTVIIAGVVNVALGLVVWHWRGDEARAAPAAVAPAGSLAPRMLVAAFLSGVAAFVYEIVWIRMLSLVLGASTHSFELMLSAFILGLALGGLLIRRRIDTLTRPIATLAGLFALMAMTAMFTLPGYSLTFDVIGSGMRFFSATDAGYAGFNLMSHAVAAAIMIPTTIIAGMTLPLITHALLKQGDERAIGNVYAANTVGAIAGVLLAVHGLLPAIGLKGALLTGALIQLVIAAVLEPRAFAAGGSRSVRLAMATGATLFVLVAAFVHLDPMRMASGVYRHGQHRLPADARVEFLRDGKTATISLVRQGPAVIIATNGKPDAAINVDGAAGAAPDEMTMTLAAALPLAMHPGPRLVANIGIGSGLTSHVLLASPQVERLDSIEIEPVMAEAARQGFGPRVARLFEDPRSHIHYEDAKTYFSAARRRYDVIVSEPSNPWVSGVATLFSDEFYAQIRRHLAADGLLVQWIQIYETDLSIVASILKALSPHFADYAVYSTDDSNIIIVARPEGRVPAPGDGVFAVPALAAELERAGIATPGDIELRRIGGKEMLERVMTAFPVPANSDFHPFVDLNAPRMRFLKRDALDLVRLSHLAVPVSQILEQPLRLPSSDADASMHYFQRQNRAAEARRILRAVESGDAELAPAAQRADLANLFAGAADCAAPEARSAWLHAVYALHARTTPYVDLEARAALWRVARASRCVATLEPPEREWFELLAALGTMDKPGIARHGDLVLRGPPPGLDGNQLVEALLATSSAMLVTGQDAQARELLSAVLPMIGNPGQYEFALRLVTALAHAPPRTGS